MVRENILEIQMHLSIPGSDHCFLMLALIYCPYGGLQCEVGPHAMSPPLRRTNNTACVTWNYRLDPSEIHPCSL